MKKSILIIASIFTCMFNANAQKLKPEDVKKLKKVVVVSAHEYLFLEKDRGDVGTAELAGIKSQEINCPLGKDASGRMVYLNGQKIANIVYDEFVKQYSSKGFSVVDAATAIIKVQDYIYAVSQYAQAALRDVVGGMTLDDLLAERQKIGDEIEAIIQKQAETWGLKVTAIKILDVDVPEELKKMMSRQASAEREKRATITKAEGDKLAAVNLAEAAKIMSLSPGAMQLRTLQTIDGLGPTASNTVVLAVPVDIMESVKALTAKLTEKKQP